MAEEWEFVAALPGIEMRGAVETDSAVIVPARDDRCGTGRLREEARIKRYLSRFRTIGREPVESVLILRRLGSRVISRDDLTLLRNIFAVSVVLLSRANRCRRHFGTGPTFSDVFDLPPASLRRGPGLIIETPAILSSGPEEEFCGHPNPTYPYGKADAVDCDRPLLERLLS